MSRIKSFKQYLTEANLYQPSEGGGRKWDKYKNNPKLKKVDFEIEKGVGETAVFDDAGNPVATVSPGDRLHILSNKEQHFPSFPARSAPAVKVRTATGQEGWVQLSKIRNPFNKSTTAVEDLVHGTIRTKFSKIVETEGPFTLYIDGKHKMENVVDIIQPNGDPKADFVVLNDKKQGVGFISHKKAGGAKAFQQYGSLSPRGSGLGQHGSPKMIKEVDKFIQDLEAFLLKNPRAERISRIYRPVQNSALVGFAIFGYDYGSNQFGLHNVNVIGQGDPIIEKYKDGYNLTFSDSTHHNQRNLKWAMTGPEQAVLIGRFSNGRKMTGIRNRVTVENRRGLIAPRALLSGNSVEI